MIRLHPLLLPVFLVASGCSTTTVFTVTEAEMAELFEESSPIESADVVLRSGEQFEARSMVFEEDSVRLDADRAAWSGAVSGGQALALRAIRNVTFTDHGEGAKEGLTRGIMVGGALVGTALLVNDDWSLLYAALLAPVVIVGGFVHGLAHGRKYRYELARR